MDESELSAWGVADARVLRSVIYLATDIEPLHLGALIAISGREAPGDQRLDHLALAVTRLEAAGLVERTNGWHLAPTDEGRGRASRWTPSEVLDALAEVDVPAVEDAAVERALTDLQRIVEDAGTLPRIESRLYRLDVPAADRFVEWSAPPLGFDDCVEFLEQLGGRRVDVTSGALHAWGDLQGARWEEASARRPAGVTFGIGRLPPLKPPKIRAGPPHPATFSVVRAAFEVAYLATYDGMDYCSLTVLQGAFSFDLPM